MQRQQALNEKLNSADPVERWKAKETLMSDGATKLGASLMRKANAAAREKQRLDEYYDRLDKNAWKPL